MESKFCHDKGYLLHYNVAVYILLQSDEEYSLIWKEKPLTIHSDKEKGKKNNDKKSKNDKTIDYYDFTTH